MIFSPAEQSYWIQTFPAIVLSATGGIGFFNIANVFVSSSVGRDDQGLGQGIFTTIIQTGTTISLAIAATVAHAGGVHVDSSKEELLHGYRCVFWLCVGILVIPFVSIWFLKGTKVASELSQPEANIMQREATVLKEATQEKL